MDLDPKETAGWLGAFVAAVAAGLGIRRASKRCPDTAAMLDRRVERLAAFEDRMQRQIDALGERLDRHIEEDVRAHERIAVLEVLTSGRKPPRP